MSHPTRRLRRLAFPLAIAGGAAMLAAPAVAGAAPVQPTLDCVAVGGKDGLVAYFGYDNPNAGTVNVPVRRGGPTVNYFTPTPSNRGQGSDFLPGTHRGIVAVDMFPDQPVTWTLQSEAGQPAKEATASIAAKRCLPNLVITIVGPPTATVGQEGTWTVTVRHDGYPDIDDALEPDAPIPVSQIVTQVPTLNTGPLTPDAASVPADGTLKPGQSLTYTVKGPVTGDRCLEGKIDQTATTGLQGQEEARTDDNTATATTPVTAGCTVDLGIAITPAPGTASPGQTVTWTVPVTNVGNTPVPISDIRVVAPGLPNLAPAPGSPTSGVLAPGASITFVATTPVSAGQCGGNITDVVRVAVGGDATPPALRDNNPANDSAVGTVGVVCGTPSNPSGGGSSCVAPRLTAGVTGARRLFAGQLTTLTLTARNRSSRTAATGTRLRYTVPAGMALVAVPRGATVSNGRVTLLIGRLAPGASRSLRLSLRVARTATRDASHRAQVTAGCSASATALLAADVTPLGGPLQPNVTG